MNIRFAGFGGQGVVLAGYVLGQAGIHDGHDALQTQSYGSESRGGACRSDVIISEGQVLELAPSSLDVLVAMSQPALDKYFPNLRKDGLLIYDSDLAKAGDCRVRAFGLPATDMAHKTFGREVFANAIMLGCLVGLTQIASRESVLRSIAESVPPKTVETNLEAFEQGVERGVEARRQVGQASR